MALERIMDNNPVRCTFTVERRPVMAEESNEFNPAGRQSWERPKQNGGARRWGRLEWNGEEYSEDLLKSGPPGLKWQGFVGAVKECQPSYKNNDGSGSTESNEESLWNRKGSIWTIPLRSTNRLLNCVISLVLIHVRQTKKPRIKYSLGEYSVGVSGIPVGTCVTECYMFWLNHTPFWRVTGGV